MDTELNKKLPVYELTIDPTGDDTEVNFLSLVENPAIQIDWVAFDESGQNKRCKFKVMDAAKQILLGPVMLANTPIYRKNPDTGEEYYVTMSPETIEIAAKKFFKNKYTNNISKDHETPVSNAYVFESWQVKDPKSDKSSLYGYKLNPGDLVMAVQIEDTNFWNSFITGKNGDFEKLLGFSVEGNFKQSNLPLGSAQKISTSEFQTQTEDMFFLELAEYMIKNNIPIPE
jgi:hypothetical protein